MSPGPADPPEPVDPDVDLRVPGQRDELSGSRRWAILAVISAGGAAGALARYAISRAWPSDAFPWTVLTINAAGSALIGVVTVLVGHGGRWARPLVRPFAGAGVLGGFTTFSAYALDFRELMGCGETGPAFGYAIGTLALCLGAVWAAVTLTRAALARGAR
ncbi:fluoride efflux transporter FluC [Streptomyces sp. NPDC020141]|uniref:fluoride efflux transporter FluC n=1 Tax=Streptomyces sp. NPDC020141 TaxID=3365065 RepID=UPI0037A23C7F